MGKQRMQVAALKPNGELPVRLGWDGAFRSFTITGGPYDAFVADFVKTRRNAFGVCVRAERVPVGVDLHLPIRDFCVPDDPTKVRDVLKRTLAVALDGRPVYVGCMGGWGRSGLFLALLAKACGVDDPVGYVREHYSSRAVETAAQLAYVQDFDVAELRGWLFRAAWAKRWADALFWWLA